MEIFSKDHIKHKLSSAVICARNIELDFSLSLIWVFFALVSGLFQYNIYLRMSLSWFWFGYIWVLVIIFDWLEPGIDGAMVEILKKTCLG